MDELVVFLQTYGGWLCLIAIIGIIILGILKYCDVFSKLSVEIRHLLYMVISVGLSIIGSAIYLACVGELTALYLFTVALAILALDQTFYALYSTLSIKELVIKFINWISVKICGKELIATTEETATEETTEEEEKDSTDGENDTQGE